MANLFRRIYDWLLRLFWYASLLSSSSCHVRALMPDALFDASTSSISAQEKSKVASDDGQR